MRCRTIQHTSDEEHLMSAAATTDTTIVLEQTSYGKSAVRLVKVTRDTARHEIRDINVDIALEGHFDACYIDGNNTDMMATDTMRNTVYAVAKNDPISSIEEFGLALVEHYLEAGPKTTRARVRLIEYLWNRIVAHGQEHDHAFVRGAGQRVATVTGDKSGAWQIEAGIDDLVILKTTNSGWEQFLHDEYTTLPDSNDRILATILTATWHYSSTDVDFGATWQGVHDLILATFTDHYSPSMQNTLYRMGKAVLETFPVVQKIHFSLPNKHHLVYDLQRFGMQNDNEIFNVTSDPYGLIEGTVERRG
jgi:urate oxidase